MKLASQAAGLRGARAEVFRGAVTIETGNTLYRFEDGVFSGRAPRPAAGSAPDWQAPPSMRGVELIGFLSDEGGLWSLSLGWRSGSMAVMTTSARALTLTSPTVAWAAERPEPRPAVVRTPSPRLPSPRPPAPQSTTRIQAMPAH